MAISVFLVDDHPMVREGVRRMIEAGFADADGTPGAAADTGIVVVGEAGTVAEALEAVEAAAPDVAVLDLRLPDGDGVGLCREIRSRHPQVACLILTSFSDDEAMAQAVAAGASGYVLKQIRGNELVSSIRAVASGQRLFDEETAHRCLVQAHEREQQRQASERLTDRERTILSLIAQGKTNRQIGAELFLAEKTVKNYVSNLLAKLGMGRRSQAAAYAARLDDTGTGLGLGTSAPSS